MLLGNKHAGETPAKNWEPSGVIHTPVGDLANEDYFEVLPDGTKKTHFTYEEAMEIEKKTNGEWRVPTQGEWAVLADEFGTGEDGELNSQKLQEALGLGLNGVDYNDGDGVWNQGSDGRYWSRTAHDSNNAYNLDLDSSIVNPQNLYYKNYGFSARLLRKYSEAEQDSVDEFLEDVAHTLGEDVELQIKLKRLACDIATCNFLRVISKTLIAGLPASAASTQKELSVSAEAIADWLDAEMSKIEKGEKVTVRKESK